MKLDKTLIEKMLWSFARAALASFLAGALGLLADPKHGITRAVLIGLSIGALTAGIRAVQHYLVD